METVSISLADLTRLLYENRHLRNQVTELQADNTRVVLERRLAQIHHCAVCSRWQGPLSEADPVKDMSDVRTCPKCLTGQAKLGLIPTNTAAEWRLDAAWRAVK